MVLATIATAWAAIVQIRAKYVQVNPQEQFGKPAWQEGGGGFFEERARRFMGLRELVGERETVGFATDRPPWLGTRMMLQSMIAPTVVVESDEQEMVIAAYEDEQKLEGYLSALEGKSTGVRVSRRLGQGVAVLQRVKR